MLSTDHSPGSHEQQLNIILAEHHVRLNNLHNNIKIVLKYFLAVLIASVILNLPKFFETSASWSERMVFNITLCDGEEVGVTETWVKLSVTKLRMNTTYIHVFSFVR